MIWKINIKKVDNGFIFTDENNLTTVIEEKEGIDAERKDAETMVELLYAIKEHFLPQRKKYNKSFVEIEIKDYGEQE